MVYENSTLNTELRAANHKYKAFIINTLQLQCIDNLIAGQKEKRYLDSFNQCLKTV